jgi:integrase/recombinase XerD
VSEHPLRIQVSGPLEPFRAGFVSELEGRGYTTISACRQVQFMAHLSRWLAGEGLDSRALSLAVAGRFLADRRAAGYRSRVSVRGIEPLLVYLRGVGAAPAPVVSVPEDPVGELLWRYRSYLTVERGLALETVQSYARAVRPFLEDRLSPQGLRLECLDGGDVISFVVARCPGLGRGHAKVTLTGLRSLLGFLFVEGIIGRPLAGTVPSAASWSLSGLPKRLESWQVQALLDSCDRGTAAGRRDAAILTVLSRLGLRSSELAALQLKDIDWRAGEIVVHGKGSRLERLPLPADVGEAIVVYLRDGRPGTVADGAVFVRSNAPHGALTRGGVSHIVAGAARRAGLAPIYAHRLRHTAASEMLRAGASLGEVGQVLRHRQAKTTAIYAKVNREALRMVACPWPQGARA